MSNYIDKEIELNPNLNILYLSNIKNDKNMNF